MAAEKRLIDANAIDYENIMCSQSQLHWLNAIIEKQNTMDAVEVVRCKDCQSHEPCMVRDRVWCRKMCRYMPKDGFCSEGKSKEVDRK